MSRSLHWWVATGLLWVLPAFGVIEPLPFDTPEQEARYQYFIDVLRCPKCQNQNLAGSDAPIAKDLRRELHRLIVAGADDQAIRDWMVARYGNFVLYETPVQRRTWLLWFGPLVLLFVGAGVVVLIVRRASRVDVVSEPADRERAKRLLEQDHD